MITSIKTLRLTDTRFKHISIPDPITESGFDKSCRNFWAKMETNMSHLRLKLISSVTVPSGQSTNFFSSKFLENKMWNRSSSPTSSGFNSIKLLENPLSQAMAYGFDLKMVDLLYCLRNLKVLTRTIVVGSLVFETLN